MKLCKPPEVVEPSGIEEDVKPDVVEVDGAKVEQEEVRARKRRRKELLAKLIQRILYDKNALGWTMTSTGTRSPGSVPFWTVRNSLEFRRTSFRASEGGQNSILDVFLFGMDFKDMIWVEVADFRRKSG